TQAQPVRGGGAVDNDMAFVDDDLGAVGRNDPGKDLYQCRLAGPVLTHQGVGLTSLDDEVHVPQDGDGAIGLVAAAESKAWHDRGGRAGGDRRPLWCYWLSTLAAVMSLVGT